MSKKSPLHDLVVDPDDFDQERLAEILRGRVNLAPESETIRFTPGTRAELTIREGAVLCVLAQEALSILDDDVERGLEPREVAELLNAKGNSVRPELKTLVEDGICVRQEDGSYTIPPFAIEDAANLLEGNTS